MVTAFHVGISISQLYQDTHMLTKLKVYEYVTCTMKNVPWEPLLTLGFALTKCSQKE